MSNSCFLKSRSIARRPSCSARRGALDPATSMIVGIQVQRPFVLAASLAPLRCFMPVAVEAARCLPSRRRNDTSRVVGAPVGDKHVADDRVHGDVQQTLAVQDVVSALSRIGQPLQVELAEGGDVPCSAGGATERNGNVPIECVLDLLEQLVNALVLRLATSWLLRSCRNVGDAAARRGRSISARGGLLFPANPDRTARLAAVLPLARHQFSPLSGARRRLGGIVGTAPVVVFWVAGSESCARPRLRSSHDMSMSSRKAPSMSFGKSGRPVRVYPLERPQRKRANTSLWVRNVWRGSELDRVEPSLDRHVSRPFDGSHAAQSRTQRLPRGVGVEGSGTI